MLKMVLEFNVLDKHMYRRTRHLTPSDFVAGSGPRGYPIGPSHSAHLRLPRAAQETLWHLHHLLSTLCNQPRPSSSSSLYQRLPAFTSEGRKGVVQFTRAFCPPPSTSWLEATQMSAVNNRILELNNEKGNVKYEGPAMWILDWRN